MRQTAFIRSGAGITEPDAAPVQPDKIVSMSLQQLVGRSAWRVGLMHDRSENMLLWVTRGQGRVFINGVRRGIGAHNAVFLPHGTLFSLDMAPQSLAQVVLSPPGRTGMLPKAPLHLRIRDSLAQAELTAEIDAMQREMQMKRPFLQEALAGHLGLIGVWLRRQDAAGVADAPAETAAVRLVKRFARMVVDQYTSDRVMQDYAAALDVTPTHLTRVCRDCSGQTAADILTARKLHEAWRRLEEDDQKINVIAADLGFHSAAYFTRFIQSHTGQSPSALRRPALRAVR